MFRDQVTTVDHHHTVQVRYPPGGDDLGQALGERGGDPTARWRGGPPIGSGRVAATHHRWTLGSAPCLLPLRLAQHTLLPTG